MSSRRELLHPRTSHYAVNAASPSLLKDWERTRAPAADLALSAPWTQQLEMEGQPMAAPR